MVRFMAKSLHCIFWLLAASRLGIALSLSLRSSNVPIPRPKGINSVDSENSVVVVGGGFIGSSFCAVFLASGKNVVCTDPFVSPQQLKDRIETVWPTVKARGILNANDNAGGSTTRTRTRPASLEQPPFERLTFEPNLEKSLQVYKNVPFVQECTVEHIESKQTMLSQLDTLLKDRPSTLISSSTSYIPHELLIQECEHHKDRVLIGHPTIPYLDSFVEIYGTNPKHVNASRHWYSKAGFEAVVMKKTIPGHLFNSFLTMNMRHGSKLIKDGVCSPTDVNIVLRHMGRFLYARHGYLSLLSTVGGERGLAGGIDLSSKIKTSAISIVFFSLLRKLLFFLPTKWVTKLANFLAAKLEDSIEPPPAKEWIESCQQFETTVTKNGSLPVPTALFQQCEPMFERTPYEVGHDPFQVNLA